MKKSITLLGVFALLVAAPSFAQEKSVENTQVTKAEPVAIEKQEITAKKQAVKAEPIKKQELKAAKIKPVQEIKAVEPKHIQEQK